MQLEISLTVLDNKSISYSSSYQLYSALVAALTKYNPSLADRFHNGENANRIKLFALSPLNSDPRPEANADKMKLGSHVYFRIASAIPEFIYEFGNAILFARELEFAGKKFKVRDVSMTAAPGLEETMTWRPFGQGNNSICTRYTLPGDRKKVYLYPDSKIPDVPSCAEIIITNLKHKLHRLKEMNSTLFDSWDRGGFDVDDIPVKIEFLPLKEGTPYSRKMHNINGSNILSWRCPIRITACEAIQRIAYDAGLGQLNATGFGLLTKGDDSTC